VTVSATIEIISNIIAIAVRAVIWFALSVVVVWLLWGAQRGVFARTAVMARPALESWDLPVRTAA
jgi:hypothetical protein